MTDVRHQRLERYETWAAECKALARQMTDPSKQKRYERALPIPRGQLPRSARSVRFCLSQIDAALRGNRHDGQREVVISPHWHLKIRMVSPFVGSSILQMTEGLLPHL